LDSHNSFRSSEDLERQLNLAMEEVQRLWETFQDDDDYNFQD
jgi:hypothetical protein